MPEQLTDGLPFIVAALGIHAVLVILGVIRGDSMKIKEKYPAVWAGLNQIPTRDLKRLLKSLLAGKPMIFSGEVAEAVGDNTTLY